MNAFLAVATSEQIRLGWLPVIATLVGREPLPLDALAGQLKDFIGHHERWVQFAGLGTGPSGNVTQSRASRLARMGIPYGVYDGARSALTDLGHVLRIVSGFGDTQNLLDSTDVYSWTKGKWSIGLRIVFEAYGDMLLALLKGWPSSGLIEQQMAPQYVADALTDIKKSLKIGDKSLDSQIARVVHHTKFRNLAYPYIEPLRDLGIVKHFVISKRHWGYQLTERGGRLKAALSEAPSKTASDWVQSGLSQAILRTLLSPEKIIRPASIAQLREQLDTLPDELLVSESEAPLEVAVLLTQAALLDQSTPQWIDMGLVRTMLGRNNDENAAIFLKSGSSVRHPNIAWSKSPFRQPEPASSDAATPPKPTHLELHTPAIAPHASKIPSSGTVLHAPEAPAVPPVAAESVAPKPQAPPKEPPSDPSSSDSSTPSYSLALLARQYLVGLAKSIHAPALSDHDISDYSGIVSTFSHMEQLSYLSEIRLNPRRLAHTQEHLPAKLKNGTKNKDNTLLLPLPLRGLKSSLEQFKNLDGDVPWVVNRVVKTWTIVKGTNQSSADMCTLQACLKNALVQRSDLHQSIISRIEDTLNRDFQDTLPDLSKTGCVLADSLRIMVFDALHSASTTTTAIKSQIAALPREPTLHAAKAPLSAEIPLMFSTMMDCQSANPSFHHGSFAWLVDDELAHDLRNSGEVATIEPSMAPLPTNTAPKHDNTEYYDFEVRKYEPQWECVVEWQCLAPSRELAEAHARQRVEFKFCALSKNYAFARKRDLQPTPPAKPVPTADDGIAPFYESRRDTTFPFREYIERRGLSQAERALYRLAVAAPSNVTGGRERLVEVWVAIEQLVAAPDWSITVRKMAECAALAVLRARILRLHREAIVALAEIAVDEGTLDPFVKAWIEHLADESTTSDTERALRTINSPTLRRLKFRNRTLLQIQKEDYNPPQKHAFLRTRPDCRECPTLPELLAPRYPWLAVQLFKFCENDGVKATLEYEFEKIESMLTFIYDQRNRIVHEGHRFEDDREYATMLVDRARCLVYGVLEILVKVSESTGGTTDTFSDIWPLVTEYFEETRSRGMKSASFRELLAQPSN